MDIQEALLEEVTRQRDIALGRVRELMRELDHAVQERRLRDRVRELCAALREQEHLWRSLPCGVDDEADPDDMSPEDVFAWTAGIAVRKIHAAISQSFTDRNGE